ncbi:hypothetical protein SAMN04487977_101564 [Treponema bryantii]|uniref:Uncharacterized protein n=1 Tax=Treponema bryantii TaxID=163 RepID=A0A1H9B3A4_9SPIR|nr:hypothetical protein [Treponema bryantii]SEP83522.1 hypothetical protein SAMN04487977_101564 [Treponema bryantii]
MTKLKELEPVVKEILKQKPATRGDDDLLYDNLLAKMNIDLSTMNARNFLLSYRKMGIPTIESVGRCRRKIQEKDETLKPTPEVVLNRKRLEKSYFTYSRGY